MVSEEDYHDFCLANVTVNTMMESEEDHLHFCYPRLHYTLR
jgi:hypothetical protein